MDKSPDAFRTISEVAEDLDVPQHVLRFWESRFAQIKPLKRGGGRRYYRPDDVDLLRGIRHLLYGEGYTIKGVQRILKAEGLRFVQSIGRGDQRAPSRPGGGGEDADNGDEIADAGDPADGPEARDPGRSASPDEEDDGSDEEPHAFAAGDLACLKTALDELLECERVLKTLAAVDDTNGPEEQPSHG
jgi:DNA-binding transcriptional MerR regulator